MTFDLLIRQVRRNKKMPRKDVKRKDENTFNRAKGCPREAKRPIRMFLVVLLILIVLLVISRPSSVLEISASAPSRRFDPVVLDYKQESLVGVLKQSLASVPGQVNPIVLEYTNENMVKALQASIMGHHNVLCGDLAELEQKPRETVPLPPDFPVLVSFRISCEDLFAHNIYGTGNVLLMLYNIRLAARLVGNVHVNMECSDAMATRSSLVVPWLMGSFAATAWPGGASPGLEDVCDSFQMKAAHIIADDIKYELRRMAVSLVGIPSESHPAVHFAQDESRERIMQVPMATSPLLPGVEIDDVAIHFRCGDIIELKAHRRYQYAPWSSLAKLISPKTRSIGIVTQPIQGQTRPFDSYNQGRCSQLLGPMQAYFEKTFPQAKVSLRNSVDETIALAFSRLIMANQSLAGGFSTFYRMPFYATFGTAYEIDEEDSSLISSERMMELWDKANGVQQILSLFTRDGV